MVRLRTCQELDFDHETSALKRGLCTISGIWNCRAWKISYGGELFAFSVFSQLNSDMADVHFEKFDPEIKGIGQVINWETAKSIAAKYKYINREQDLGIEGCARPRNLTARNMSSAPISWKEKRLKGKKTYFVLKSSLAPDFPSSFSTA